MVNFAKNTPQIPVVLASLIVWVSFAWGLPAETGDGDAEPATGDVWAGVKFSDAYDYAKCSECGYENEVRADICAACGYELPQPSADMADSDMVFVPGKGYYEEGALLEPGRSGKGLKTAGLILIAVGLAAFIITPSLGYSDEHGSLPTYASVVAFYGGLGMIAVGVILLIGGRTSRKEPVYAFADGEAYEPYERPAFSRRPPDAGGRALTVEVTLLSF